MWMITKGGLQLFKRISSLTELDYSSPVREGILMTHVYLILVKAI